MIQEASFVFLIGPFGPWQKNLPLLIIRNMLTFLGRVGFGVYIYKYIRSFYGKVCRWRRIRIIKKQENEYSREWKARALGTRHQGAAVK